MSDLRERVAQWLYRYIRPVRDYPLWSQMEDADREYFRKDADCILALFDEERRALKARVKELRKALEKIATTGACGPTGAGYLQSIASAALGKEE